MANTLIMERNVASPFNPSLKTCVVNSSMIFTEKVKVEEATVEHELAHRTRLTYFSILGTSLIIVLVVLILGTLWNSLMLTLGALAINMTIAASLSEYRVRHSKR